MSRRLIAFTVSLVLLLACFAPMGVSAESENLIFDLDLSGSTEDDILAVNAVTGGNSSITVKGSPQLGEINGMKFLNFGTRDSVDRAAAIKIEDSDFANNDQMTFEMWIKGFEFGTDSSGSMQSNIAVMATADTGDSAARFEIYSYPPNSLHYRPSGPNNMQKATGGTVGYVNNEYWKKTFDYDEEWSHFVFTRVWTKSGDGGKWSGDLYINGVKQSASIRNADSVGLRADETDMFLVIGNRSLYDRSFLGDVAKFRVYNSVLSASSIMEKYEAEKMNFVNYPDTLEVETLSVDGDTIDEMEGSINITFNNYLDVSTVADGISFTKEDGSEIGGGAYISADSDFTNQVRISFGKLDAGEIYSLNITPKLKSINKKPYSGQESFVYTAEKGYIFYEDFMGEEYTVGENPPTGGVLNYTSSDSDGSAENIMVCGDEFSRYISMTGGGTVNKNSRITLNFGTEISDDAFVMDLKIRPASMGTAPNDNTPRDVLTVKGPSASVRLANMRYGYLEANTAPGAAASLAGDINFTETDENGFYDAQIIFEKNGDGNYIMTLKNANAENEGEAVFTTNNIKSIKSIELSHLYPLDDTQATMVSADIAKIAISKLIVPKIIYTNFGELERDDNTVKIVFNDALSSDTVDERTFSIVAPDGENVNAEFGGYDEETRTATLILRDYLEPSTEYTLCVREAEAVSGLVMRAAEYPLVSKAAEIQAESVKVYNQNNVKIENLNGATEIKASVAVANNGTDDTVCTAVLMMYGDDGRILGFSKNVEDGTVSGNSDGTVNVKGTLPEGVKTVKIMAWAEKDNGAVSLMMPVVIEKNN